MQVGIDFAALIARNANADSLAQTGDLATSIAVRPTKKEWDDIERRFRRAAEYHFPLDAAGVVRPGSVEAKAKVVAATKTCNLKDFAEGLHVLQDSWSHQGVPYLNGIGHWRGVSERKVRDGSYAVWHEDIKLFGFIPWRVSHTDFGYKVEYKQLHGIEAFASTSTDEVKYWHADVRATSMATYQALLKFKKDCQNACCKNGKPSPTSSGPAQSEDGVGKFLEKEYPGKNVINVTLPAKAR